MRLALGAFTFVICFKLCVMVNGTPNSFGKYTFDFVVSCMTDMISTSDRSA